SATLTVTNTTLSGNSASGYGGAIYSDGTLTVSNSTFSGNSAINGDGGAIDNNSGTATISGTTFTGHQAYIGGAIVGGGTLNVLGCTLTDNSASDLGGAIAVGGASTTATINGCTITNNSAGGGGGIYNEPYAPASLTDSNTTFSG